MQKSTVLAAAVLALLLPGTALAERHFRGIVVYPTASAITNGDFDQAISVPGVDAIALAFDWAEIQPDGPTSFDFHLFDQYLNSAKAHHVKVELAIRAGHGTPSWLFSLGAQRLDFEYSNHAGLGEVTQISMAPPWDRTFQSAFIRMLNEVAAHIKSFGAWDTLAVVKLTGINTISEELRLPNQTPASTGGAVSIDSNAVWLNAGYRPSRVEDSLGVLAAAFLRAFRSKDIVLPIIPRNGFPPILESGVIVPVGDASVSNGQMLQHVIGSSADTLDDSFVLQHDFLICGEPADPDVMGYARQFELPVAWQTNLYLGSKGQGAASAGSPGTGTPPNNQTFLALLLTGIFPDGGADVNQKGRFIEVFPYDAIHSSEAILAAHSLLVGADPESLQQFVGIANLPTP